MVTEKLIHYLEKVLSEGLGFDLKDPNFEKTAERMAKMYQDEFFANFQKGLTKKEITVFPNEGYDEIVMFDNIPFTSICSHHLLPFTGLAWFLYIPDKWLIGASKPARIINFFSKSPQLQERLSAQIMEAFYKEVTPKGAMLVMRAVHGCMSCRGICTGKDAGMTTSVTKGAFRDDPKTRQEGLELIKMSITLK